MQIPHTKSRLNSGNVSATAGFPMYFKRFFACDFKILNYFQDNSVSLRFFLPSFRFHSIAE